MIFVWGYIDLTITHLLVTSFLENVRSCCVELRAIDEEEMFLWLLK